MKSRSNLLKELGWSDDLINHYMIEDDVQTAVVSTKEESIDVFETNTVTFKAEPIFVSSFRIRK